MINDIVIRLNEILNERDNLYPLREPSNTVVMHEYLDCLVEHLDAKKVKHWHADPLLVQSALNFRNYPVFVCGHMKSGTTLLLSLLDGHLNLNVMPGDSYLFNKFSKNPPKKKYKWKEWRSNWLKRMINPTGQKPFWVFGSDLSSYTDFLNYMDFWIEKLPAEKRRPMLVTVLAYFCSNSSRPESPKWWVEKTPGNELRARDIIEHFPRAKFIHIVRDPRDNFASLKRLYVSRKWVWNPNEMVRMFSKSFKHAYSNQRQLGKSQYLLISYENLTANPETVMKGIAEFLDVAWSDSLLEPTLNKQPAQANTMYKERRITGKVRYSGKGRWNEDLSVEEKRVIKSILPEARKIGYNWEMSYRNYLEMYFCRLRMRL